jgi:hypothetical protein
MVRVSMAALHILFPQHMISHYDVLRAPHSPNLTDLDFLSEDTLN